MPLVGIFDSFLRVLARPAERAIHLPLDSLGCLSAAGGEVHEQSHRNGKPRADEFDHNNLAPV
jgi:hypothetical protein